MGSARFMTGTGAALAFATFWGAGLPALLPPTLGPGSAKRLEREGKSTSQVDLYGIYLDTDKATLRPESAQVLHQVLAMLKAKPELRIAIAGHTDSHSSDLA